MSEVTDSLDDLFRDILSPRPTREHGPFKFLDPYGPDDNDIFFGRDAETAELYRKFFNAPLLVVYGPSGAGKTSLIQCGLRGEIPKEDVQFVTVRAARDPLKALRGELLRLTNRAVSDKTKLDVLIEETIERKSKTLVLIFDQFEELFLFQPKAVREELVSTLCNWLCKGLNLRVIIGIREEFLAQITELEHYLPEVYNNRVWVRRMGRDQAQEAILGPCRAENIEIDPDLVDELLRDLALGDQEVELPILQLVLDTLYRRAVERDDPQLHLRKEDYAKLGRIKAILGSFLKDRLVDSDDPDRCQQVLKAMVTPEGTRQLSTTKEICSRSGQFGSPLSRKETDLVLQWLVAERIVREESDGKLFELRHDSLARTIHEWMSGSERELTEIRQVLENRLRDHRKFKVLLDEDVLHQVEPYLPRLKLSPELCGLVDASRRALNKRKMRLLALGGALLAATLITVSALAILNYFSYIQASEQRNEALLQKNEARRNLGAALFEKAQRAYNARRYNEAAICAAEAWEKDPSQYYPGLVQDEGLLTPMTGFMQAGDKTVTDAIFSTDGRYLFTAHYDNFVRQWDTQTQTLIGEVAKHGKEIRQIELVDGDKRLISSDYEGSIKIFRLADGTGKFERILSGHDDKIYALAVDQSGERLVSGDAKGVIELWRWSTGERLLESALNIGTEVMSAAFTPNGRQLITASATNGPLTLWQLDTGVRVDLRETLSASIWDLAISPDGRYLITADRGGEITTWDLVTGDPVSQHREPASEFLSVTLLPAHGRLLTGDRKGRVKLWSANPTSSNDRHSEILAHATGVWRIPYASTTGTFATVSSAGQIKLWRPNPNVGPRPFSGHDGGITDMDLSDDGRYLVTSGNSGKVRLWNALNGQLIRDIEIPGNPKIVKVAFRPGADQIAYIRGATFVLMDYQGRTLLEQDFDNKTTILTPILFTSDGAKVLLPLRVNQFFTLDIESRTVEREFPGHDMDLYSMALDEREGVIASAGGKRMVRFWSLQDGSEISPLLPHDSLPRAMDIDAGVLVTGTEKGRVRLWTIDTHDELHSFSAFPHQINRIRLSSEAGLLAAGSGTGVIKLWDTESWELLETLHGHGGGITSLRFSRDGGTLFSSGEAGRMRKWDINEVLSGSAENYLKRIRRLTGLQADGISIVPMGKDVWQAVSAVPAVAP